MRKRKRRGRNNSRAEESEPITPPWGRSQSHRDDSNLCLLSVQGCYPLWATKTISCFDWLWAWASLIVFNTSLWSWPHPPLQGPIIAGQTMRIRIESWDARPTWEYPCNPINHAHMTARIVDRPAIASRYSIPVDLSRHTNAISQGKASSLLT